MKALLIWVLAVNAHALPDWLSWGGGIRYGMGPSQYTGEAHPPPPRDPNNLFSQLGNQVTQSREPSLGGGAGISLSLGWKRRIEAQGELSATLEGSKAVEDLGSGVKREVEYQRSGLEWPVLLKLGWPFKNGMKPYAIGGYWHSHLLASRQVLGIQGGSAPKEYEWKGTPSEDWGWCYGLGMEMETGIRVIRKLGLELRYREGRNDLDPKGSFEQKSRTLQASLSLGY